MLKKCLISRFGAYGDCIIITPVIRYLKQQGYYIIINVSERGMEILKNNPNIDEFIFYKSDSVSNDKLDIYWEDLKKKTKADLFINFAESIEVSIALHPADPEYNSPKNERLKYSKINYYENSFKFADIDIKKVGIDTYIPELFFTKKEEKEAKSMFNKNDFNIVWGLSGSGKNKCYPWTDIIINNILSLYPSVRFFLLGDTKCKILEHGWDNNKRVECLSGDISMRKSLSMTKYADLVISPDTGLLHGSGCYSTPKIGLLGHTTIENITKHFYNDLSLESDPSLAECSPCSRLIYDLNAQCPVELESNSAWCMYYGISPDRLENRIKEIINIKSKNENK